MLGGDPGAHSAKAQAARQAQHSSPPGREEGGEGLEGGEVPSLKPDPRARSVPSAALAEPQLCYILDAILFLYGIVLTLLYCRLKVRLAGGAGWLPGQRRGEGGAEGCP